MNNFYIQRIQEFFLSKYRPRLTGTVKEILKEVSSYSRRPGISDNNGVLIRYIGCKDDKYAPYYFTKENRGKLLFRKRNNGWYIPGDCGTHSLEWPGIFELIEIPPNLFQFQYQYFTKIYRVKLTKKLAHEFY